MRVVLVIIGICIAISSFALAEESFPYEIPEDELVPIEQAIPQNDDYFVGEVIRVEDEQEETIEYMGTQPFFLQTLRVEFTSGPREGEEETIEYGVQLREQRLQEGDRVVLMIIGDRPFILERYRLPAIGAVVALFVFLAVLFAGWRGFMSLAGLGVTVAVILLYVIPQIMDGKNPLVVSIIASCMIVLVSIYLAHGFNRRTTVAVISTLGTVIIAIGAAQLFVRWVGLSGAGSQESYHLLASQAGFINLKGLLLGGIIIGALGILDDITTGQAAAVQEIWRANSTLSRRDLFRRGLRVGKEHIISLVNTLALAYIGASLPAILLFAVYERPWWVIANTEGIAEEIIRTIVGSAALVVAVPITTFLAVIWLRQKESPTAQQRTPAE